MLIRQALSLLLFAALCAVAGFWVIQLRAPTPEVAPIVQSQTAMPPLDASLHGRLFGESMVAVNSSIRVAGVMAPSDVQGQGIALLVVDDKPARAYGSGQTISPGTVLKEVRTGEVIIEQGGALLQLPVPLAKGANTSPVVNAAGRSPVPALPPSGAAAGQLVGTPGNPARALEPTSEPHPDPRPNRSRPVPADLGRGARPSGAAN
jgi:general secretion pathway protein C